MFFWFGSPSTEIPAIYQLVHTWSRIQFLLGQEGQSEALSKQYSIKKNNLAEPKNASLSSPFAKSIFLPKGEPCHPNLSVQSPRPSKPRRPVEAAREHVVPGGSSNRLWATERDIRRAWCVASGAPLDEEPRVLVGLKAGRAGQRAAEVRVSAEEGVCVCHPAQTSVGLSKSTVMFPLHPKTYWTRGSLPIQGHAPCSMALSRKNT